MQQANNAIALYAQDPDAQGPRGRASTPTPAVAVPLGDPTPPPTDLIVEYTEKAMTVKWTPSPARTWPTVSRDGGVGGLQPDPAPVR